jgi:hypothetical protein
MAKKIKLEIDFTEDNTLIGISCHKKDYWFAYHVNDTLNINLRRLKDFPFFQPRLNESLHYPFFHYSLPDDQLNFFLINNLNQQGPLFPELKTTDFFILLQGRLADNKRDEILSGIRKIPGVLAVYLPDAGKIKEYHNFLSDLELHMTDLKIKD